MDTSAEPEQTRRATNAAGPPIRQLFRDVVADRVQGPWPPQAAMLFDEDVDPCWDNRSFLGDFDSGILHQDTCWPATADGPALVTALASRGPRSRPAPVPSRRPAVQGRHCR